MTWGNATSCLALQSNVDQEHRVGSAAHNHLILLTHCKTWITAAYGKSKVDQEITPIPGGSRPLGARGLHT